MGALTSTSDVAHIQDLLDARIQALEKETLDAKQQRNRVSLVVNLPPEILCAIFSLYQKSFPRLTRYRRTTFMLGHPSQRSMKWILITHICQRWRNIALGYGRLWADLSPGFSPTLCLQAMFDRSINSPITLHFEPSTRHDQITQKVMLAALSATRRWEQVKIRLQDWVGDRKGDVGYTSPNNLQALTAPAPYLTDLSVEVGDSQSPCPFPILPEDFLQGRAPVLRRLKLFRCVLPWQSELYCGLSSLQLTLPPPSGGNSSTSDALPTAQQLMDILSRMPVLDTLELEMNLPDLSSLPSKTEPLSLPCLKVLCLTGVTKELAALTARLTIPSSARIDLRCALSNEGSLARLGEALQRAWVTPPAFMFAEFTRNSGRVEHRHGVSIAAYDGGNPGDEELKDPMLSISVSTFIPGTAWNSLFLPSPSSLLRFPSLKGIDTLEFIDLQPLDLFEDEVWPAIFTTLSNIKRLELHPEIAASFVTAASEYLKNDVDQPFLPKLEALVLIGVNVAPNWEEIEEHNALTQDRTVLVDHLIHMLQRRKATLTSSAAQHLAKLEFVKGYGLAAESEIKTLLEAGVATLVVWTGQELPLKDYGHGMWDDLQE